MRSVYKYPLVLHDSQVLKLPKNSKVLYVGTQWSIEDNDTKICLWVEVHADCLEDLEDRRFDIHGTGHIIMRDDAVYVGTVQMPPNTWGTVFVWHVYEVPYDV